MRFRRLLLRLIVAGAPAPCACVADDVGSDSDSEGEPPSQEEIEQVQEDICEIRTVRCLKATDPAPQSMEECLEIRRNAYAYSEECLEVYFAADSCRIEVEAGIHVEDPLYEYYVCQNGAPECSEVNAKQQHTFCNEAG